MLTAASFLPTRLSRFIFFLLCSPILLPLLFLSIPLLCAVEIFSRLRCRILKNSSPSSVVTAVDEDDDLRRCEEGCGGRCEEEFEEDEIEEEGGLLQRYLEDQMVLAKSIYDCGEEEDDGDHDLDPVRVPLLL